MLFSRLTTAALTLLAAGGLAACGSTPGLSRLASDGGSVDEQSDNYADDQPVQASRSLTVGDLAAATKGCALALVDALHLPFHPAPIFSSILDPDQNKFSFWSSTQENNEIQLEHNIRVLSSGDMTQGRGGAYYKKLPDGQFLRRGLHLHVCDDCFSPPPSGRDVTLVLARGIPAFRYTWAPSDLGETVGNARKITALSMMIPKDFGPSVPLVNEDSGLTTAYKVDLVAYQTCLTDALR